jgi:DNA-directed RNA polymerase subunit alpha
MHVRWRGLELPARVELDEKSSSDTFGRFTVEPFERGFGTTIGNSLRRILLSSIEGAAITSVRIKGVDHEFTTIPGIIEDVSDIILNIKGIVISHTGEEEKVIRLSASGPGEVTADLIASDPAITVHNPDLIIATLTEAVDFEVEMIVAPGRGYQPATERHLRSSEDQVIGEIPIDSLFSPVRRVRYRVEDTRVGQKTNYDRLILDLWTDSTISPEMAMVEAAKILRKHLNPFVQYFDLGDDRISEEASAAAAMDDELIRKLDMRIDELDLTVRARNCLDSAQIETVGELVSKSDQDLLSVRSFGRTSLREVKRRLEELGLSLGTPLPDGYEIQISENTGEPIEAVIIED